MMRLTAAELESKDDQSPQVIKNALVESFAVHARCLIEFLFEKSKKDYVSASDFVQGWAVQKPETLGRTIGRASAEIVHLTFNRRNLSDEAKNWNLAEIQKQILEAFSEFLERAPSTILCSEMQSLKERPSKIGRAIPLQGTTASTTFTSSTFAVLIGELSRNTFGRTS
jgi:hypothetical protein